jgi:hypothetical protein
MRYYHLLLSHKMELLAMERSQAAYSILSRNALLSTALDAKGDVAFH